MAEYIKKLTMRNCCIDEDGQTDEPIIKKLNEVIDFINSKDVSPVRHGRWIEPPRLYYGAKQYECSLCYSDTFWNKHSITEKYPCCPNCGATMDGGAD